MTMLPRSWTTRALSSALLVAALAAPATVAWGGTVYLLNNEEIEGEILDVGVDFVVVRVPGGRQSIPLREVRDVEFRSGESMWEKKLKDALARAKAQRDAERAGRRDRELSEIKRIVPVGNTGGSAAAPVAVPVMGSGSGVGTIDLARFSGTFDSDKIFVRFPATFQPNQVDGSYITFKEDRASSAWTFNMTFFNGRDEGDYDAIRGRAQNELERIPLYHARQRLPISIGQRAAERTIGLYERNGRAVRHDQIVVPASSGVFVIHFFSPGATMDEGAVPDVDTVIKSIIVK